jgi:hypothetical protein
MGQTHANLGCGGIHGRGCGIGTSGNRIIGTSGNRFTAKDAEHAKENQGLPLIHADGTDQENRDIGESDHRGIGTSETPGNQDIG